MTQRPAVIDIGSNSVRLVIYEDFTTTTTVFYNEKFSCKLGRLTDDGYLSDKAKHKTLEALKRFKKICDANQVSTLRVIATAAMRDAKDGVEFAKFLSDETLLYIEIISGTQEAYHAAKGVSCKIPSAIGCVGDLGGGSLELSFLNKGVIDEDAVSLPLGTLRLENDIGHPFKRQEYATHIDKILSNCSFTCPENSIFYCVGGSWRALMKFYMHVHNIPIHVLQNFSLKAEHLKDFIELIISGRMNVKEYNIIDYIPKRRVNMLPSAALVLLKLIEKYKFSHIVTSVAGIREGILTDLLHLDYPCESSSLGFAISEASIRCRNVSLFPHFIRILQQILPDLPENFKVLSKIMIYMSDIAYRRHIDFRADYVFQFVLYASLDDLTHFERILVAAAMAWRYDPDFQIPEAYIIYLKDHIDDLYWSKAIAFTLRYLFSVTGMSHFVAQDLNFMRHADHIENLSAVTTLPQGEETEKRFQALHRHIFKAA